MNACCHPVAKTEIGPQRTIICLFSRDGTHIQPTHYPSPLFPSSPTSCVALSALSCHTHFILGLLCILCSLCLCIAPVLLCGLLTCHRPLLWASSQKHSRFQRKLLEMIWDLRTHMKLVCLRWVCLRWVARDVVVCAFNTYPEPQDDQWHLSWVKVWHVLCFKEVFLGLCFRCILSFAILSHYNNKRTLDCATLDSFSILWVCFSQQWL